jgi:CubicO group peptidase (beta-lactamase class C family)
VLLTLIVAIVSGQSFADFLQANVFDPLGMKHTLVYNASRPVLHKLARGYFEENGQFQRWDYPLLTAGDGGLFSTLDDLFLWDQALNTERLVPKIALEQAFTSGTANDGTPNRLWLRLDDESLCWSTPRRACGQPLHLRQLHDPFSRYSAHDRCPDQSLGRSQPSHPGASGRENPLQRLSREAHAESLSRNHKLCGNGRNRRRTASAPGAREAARVAPKLPFL